MKATWYLVLASNFKAPNAIQPCEHSKGSGTDGLREISASEWYVNLDVNDGQRNVNVNRVNPDNEFNDDCRVLVR